MWHKIKNTFKKKTLSRHEDRFAPKERARFWNDWVQADVIIVKNDSDKTTTAYTVKINKVIRNASTEKISRGKILQLTKGPNATCGFGNWHLASSK